VIAAEKPAVGHDLAGIPHDWKNVLAVADAVQRSLDSRQAVSLEGR
jgi:hypothetical protein